MRSEIAIRPGTRVGLNLVYLVPGETGGTETYARELIPALLKAAPELDLIAFVNRETAAAGNGPWDEMVPAVTVPVEARRRTEWVRGEQLLLPRLAAEAGIDLLHSLALTAPFRGRFRRITTIHDLHYRTAPDAHFGLRGMGMRVLVPLGAHRSHRVLTDSHAVHDQLVRLMRLSADRIDVVPLGAGPRFSADPLPEHELREQHRLGERPLLLTVSAKRPHKNLPRLLEALAQIPANRRPVLILPGYPTPHEAELRAQVTATALEDDTRFLGWVGAAELEGLYAAATAFVFPSLSEGFGLPVLEAMRRGVPVACSGEGAVAEVAGDSALLFNPHSSSAMAAALERLLNDSELRACLRTAGLERAARFTWEAAGRGTLASYARSLE